MKGRYLLSAQEYHDLLAEIGLYKAQIARLKEQRNVAVALAASREELLEKLLAVTRAKEEDR